MISTRIKGHYDDDREFIAYITSERIIEVKMIARGLLSFSHVRDIEIREFWTQELIAYYSDKTFIES